MPAVSNVKTNDGKAPAGPRTLVAFIDSIEEGVARLVETDAGGKVRSHAFPAALLPAGAKEGTWVEISVHAVAAPVAASVTTPVTTEDPAALRKKLGKGDTGGDFSL